MDYLFEQYKTIILFLHILSAVIWVGGMIVIKLVVHPSLQSIENKELRLGQTLQIIGTLFHLVMPFIVISLVTAIITIKALGYTGGIIHFKEAIWTIMTLNFAYMYVKRLQAQRFYDKHDFTKAKEAVALLPTLLLPLNIFLGLSAIFIGVVLRG